MKTNYYGRTFHVFDTKELGFGRSKKEIIEAYKNFSSSMRQRDRIGADLIEINNLPESRYSFLYIQDAGHRYQCSSHMVWNHRTQKHELMKSIWISHAIKW